MSLLWALNSQFHFQKGRIFFGGNTKMGFLYIAQSEWNSLCRPDGLEFSEISLSLPLSVGSKGVRPHAWLFKFIHFWRLHQPVSHDWKTFEIKLKGRKLINIFYCFRSVVSWLVLLLWWLWWGPTAWWGACGAIQLLTPWYLWSREEVNV